MYRCLSGNVLLSISLQFIYFPYYMYGTCTYIVHVYMYVLCVWCVCVCVCVQYEVDGKARYEAAPDMEKRLRSMAMERLKMEKVHV